MTAFIPTHTELDQWAGFFWFFVAVFALCGGYAWCLGKMADRVQAKWQDAERRRLDALMHMRRMS